MLTSGSGAKKLLMGMINFKISSSTELNMKLIMLIKVEMPTIVRMVKTISDNLNPLKVCIFSAF